MVLGFIFGYIKFVYFLDYVVHLIDIILVNTDILENSELKKYSLINIS